MKCDVQPASFRHVLFPNLQRRPYPSQWPSSTSQLVMHRIHSRKRGSRISARSQHYLVWPNFVTHNRHLLGWYILSSVRIRAPSGYPLAKLPALPISYFLVVFQNIDSSHIFQHLFPDETLLTRSCSVHRDASRLRRPLLPCFADEGTNTNRKGPSCSIAPSAPGDLDL